MKSKQMSGKGLSRYDFWIISMLILFLPVSVIGQNTGLKPVNKEIRITSSNDNFWPPFYDRYFTNGLDIGFSKALGDRKILGNLIPQVQRKSIIHFKAGQKLYTSQSITEKDVSKFDRPYAAFLYLRTSLNVFWKNKHNLKMALTSGIIGPKAGGRQVQSWWHKLINYSSPEGWEHQIGNEPVLNVELKYLRSWLFSNRFEILSNTGFQAGTSFNNLYTGTTVRTGKILVFDHSALTGSRLNKNSTLQAGSQYNDNEWFLFLGFNYTFVLHNSLIEGGLLDPLKSKHTEDAESFFATMKAGIAFSTPIHTCKVTTHWLSPEVVGGKSHNYASIDISVRF